jgi:DNA-binding transcriptional LysR family regulator
VELVVAHDPPPSDTLHEIVSLEQPLCAVMRPDHPLASRTSMRLADCQRHPIALCTDAFGSRRLIDQLAGKMHLSMQVIFEANSMETLKNFVRTSQAICFQSQIGTLKETRHDNLVAIPLIDRELQGRLVMGARAGRTLPVAATGFIQDLKTALEDA